MLVSEQKHTPGPWDVSADGEAVVSVGPRFVLVRAVSANEHDMNLVAAAPELLRAAQMLIDDCPGMVCECGRVDACARCAAQTAVAKAIGR